MGLNNMKGFGSGMLEEDWFRKGELIEKILDLVAKVPQPIGDIYNMTVAELEEELARLMSGRSQSNN
jgi:hypothetical protein